MLTEEEFENISGKRILILEWSTGAPHFERSVELYERLSEQNEVSFIGPWSFGVTENLQSISNLKRIQQIVFNYKRYRIARDLERKSRDSRLREMFTKPSQEADSFIKETLYKKGLREAEYEGFLLAEAIQSSCLTLNIPFGEKGCESSVFLREFARSVLQAFLNTRQICRSGLVDSVFIYNGRMATSRAIRSACEELQFEYYVHEVSFNDLGKFSVFRNSTVHDIKSWKHWVHKWSLNSNCIDLDAAEFFDCQRRDQRGYDFNKNQIKGWTGRRAEETKGLVVFFHSSEDEFSFISQYVKDDGLLCNQEYALRAVKRICDFLGYEFLIRVHPRQALLKGTDWQSLLREFSECVISPGSQVDTYALIESADFVIAHKSTVALEAAYIGKPVIMTGRSMYEDCESIVRCKSEQELQGLLTSGFKHSSKGAVKYGAFMGKSGIKYSFYKPVSITNGCLHGKNLDVKAPTSLVLLLVALGRLTLKGRDLLGRRM